MTKTVDSNAGSLLDAATFLKTVDARTVGDLVVDDDTGRVPAGSLATNENLLECLKGSTGLLEQACLVGGRYKPADLAALAASSTAGRAGLFRLLSRLTLVLLFERRPNLELKQPWVWEQAMDTLQRLRDGELVFPFTQTEAAGLPAAVKETAADVLARGGVVTAAERLFGTRNNRRGDFG